MLPWLKVYQDNLLNAQYFRHLKVQEFCIPYMFHTLFFQISANNSYLKIYFNFSDQILKGYEISLSESISNCGEAMQS